EPVAREAELLAGLGDLPLREERAAERRGGLRVGLRGGRREHGALEGLLRVLRREGDLGGEGEDLDGRARLDEGSERLLGARGVPAREERAREEADEPHVLRLLREAGARASSPRRRARSAPPRASSSERPGWLSRFASARTSSSRARSVSSVKAK